jgi:hypothetical protein
MNTTQQFSKSIVFAAFAAIASFTGHASAMTVVKAEPITVTGKRVQIVKAEPITVLAKAPAAVRIAKASNKTKNV